MKKHLIPETRFDLGRKRKKRGHVELFAYPSDLAMEIWNHVLAIDISRCPPGFDKPHAAKRCGYTLHYVPKSELLHTLDNRTFTVPAGSLCLLDACKVRRVRNPGPKAVTLWGIYFNGRTMPRMFTELRAAENPVFHGVNSNRFENLYHELWQVVTRKPPAYEATAHAVLSAMLAELFAARARDRGLIKSPEPATAFSGKVRFALDFVARLYTENIGLKHIAEGVHLNVHHFSRKFRQEVGMAPIQYLYHFRVEQAKRLLADTDRPVGEIARLVGIPDQRYFARLFRDHTGESPHAFRKKEQESKASSSGFTGHSRQQETKKPQKPSARR